MCGQPAASSGTAAASGDTAASSNSFVADGPPRGHGGGTGSAGARADDAGGGGGGENPSRRQPADAQRTRCCRGLTYFSQAMLETGKLPACVGLPTSPAEPPDLSGVPPETVPSGDFKYICLGYSLYEAAQLQDSWRDAKTPGAPLQVPYCEGVEIVSAAETAPTTAPLLLKEGLDLGSQPPMPMPDQQPPERPRQPRPRFATPPPSPGPGQPVDWSAFPERFSKTAGLIVDRMGSNLSYMAASVKRNVGKLVEEATGRKRDR